MVEDNSPSIGGGEQPTPDDDAPGLGRLWKEYRAAREIRVELSLERTSGAAAAIEQAIAGIRDLGNALGGTIRMMRDYQTLSPAVLQERAEEERKIIEIQILLNLPNAAATALHQRMLDAVRERAAVRPISVHDLWNNAWWAARNMMARGTFSEESWLRWLGQ